MLATCPGHRATVLVAFALTGGIPTNNSEGNETKLPPPKPAEDAGVDTQRMERAKALVPRNRCNFCHQENLAGLDNVPRIAGQREDYLVKTLREYKSGARTGYDQAMLDVVAGIDDAQILDLAYYLARVK